jgi:hypothetical protein
MGTPKLQIATSRYQAHDLILGSGLAPVATTVGKPKFALHYDLAGACDLIAPLGVFGRSLSDEQFEAGYRARVDRVGVDAIRAELTTITGERPGCVLLCFCDLAASRCHRRVFARWWEERTGEPIAELEPESAPALF